MEAPSPLQEALTGRVLSEGPGAQLCQVRAKNSWEQGGTPAHGEVSVALGEKLYDSGGRREMARAGSS